MNGEVPRFLTFLSLFILKRNKSKCTKIKAAESRRVFHSFSLSVEKKPVEKVEKSVDNSKTRLLVNDPSQTLETRRQFFCQAFF